MAVPHASGVAALLLADSNDTLQPVHVRERFATTAQIPENTTATKTRYGYGVINATLAVDSPNQPVGESKLPPRDRNHNGLYTDVNGDGNISITDVELMFQERDSTELNQNKESFDFDDDSNISVGDVQKLYNHTVSNTTA